MVPEVGIEPTRGCPRWILSPVRLPVSPLRRSVLDTPEAPLSQVESGIRKFNPFQFPTASLYPVFQVYFQGNNLPMRQSLVDISLYLWKNIYVHRGRVLKCTCNGPQG